jgi:hypothetical protein
MKVFVQKIFPLTSAFSLAFGICINAFFSGALAQAASPSISVGEHLPDSKGQIKSLIIGCFLVLLFILFLVCLLMLLYNKDKDKVAFASDVIKTLTGFFVGAITGYLG